MTHYEEDRDYWMGAATELQNAFALSQMEKQDDTAAINELVSLGRFIVVCEGTAYCGRTDAIMGVARHMVGDFATFDEANDCLKAQGEGCEDFDFRIYQPKVTTPTVVYDWSDCPF